MRGLRILFLLLFSLSCSNPETGMPGTPESSDKEMVISDRMSNPELDVSAMTEILKISRTKFYY